MGDFDVLAFLHRDQPEELRRAAGREDRLANAATRDRDLNAAVKHAERARMLRRRARELEANRGDYD